VVLQEKSTLLRYERRPQQVELVTTLGCVVARVMVAADGLTSGIRHAEGLDIPVRSRRFGIRQHWSCPPWVPEVELHFAPGVEAYVTPVGPDEVGIAFLVDARRFPAGYPDSATSSKSVGRHVDYFQQFPEVSRRLGSAKPVSQRIGSGFLERRAREVALDRLVLIGDAAGYLDAITGEGLSIGFANALDLASVLPDAIARGARARDFGAYTRVAARRFARYKWATKAMLVIARSPALQGVFLRSLAGSELFRQAVARVATETNANAHVADVRALS
jgi:2-polyprenyl-6-methoxyphenol hydroxylase-like FAD-dependent oxidoreductase